MKKHQRLIKLVRAIKLSFPRRNVFSYPPLSFNNNIVSQTKYQKHHGIFLDARLTFIISTFIKEYFYQGK